MENMGTNTNAQNSGTDGQQEPGKTFTQDEVNKIVQDRLARQQAKTAEDQASLEQREKDLQKREAVLTAKELLREKELPESFSDILDLSDVETLPEKLETIRQAIQEYMDAHKPIIKGVQPGQGTGLPPMATLTEAEREAFGL